MRFIVVAIVSAAAACTPCRRIETTPIELDCAQNASFLSGEIHLDSPANYRSFLSDRCLPDSDPAAIDALVDDVDFTRDAVFVARGDRAGTERCLEERKAESVDVCEGGLRVVFDDLETGADGCAGKWTVAFVIARNDLRDAIDDNDASVVADF